MSDLVEVSRDRDIAVITIHNPPVNALSPGVPEGSPRPSSKSGGTTASKPSC